MASDVLEKLTLQCDAVGMECYTFKIGWYNDLVQSAFHFPHNEDTLAVLFISTPSMFEKLFLPYLATKSTEDLKIDPLDQCMKAWFEKVSSLFPEIEIDTFQDFERHTNNRAKVLVQTAGHVSGGAYLYQRSDVVVQTAGHVSGGAQRSDVVVQTAGHVSGGAYLYQRSDVVDKPPWSSEQKIYPVSVHPKFGGWFALRGVMIFKDVLAPAEMGRKAPVDCVRSRERRIELLDKYNFHWRDWIFRDVCDFDIVERYSERQKVYFSTEPAKRHDLIASWKPP